MLRIALVPLSSSEIEHKVVKIEEVVKYVAQTKEEVEMPFLFDLSLRLSWLSAGGPRGRQAAATESLRDKLNRSERRTACNRLSITTTSSVTGPPHLLCSTLSAKQAVGSRMAHCALSCKGIHKYLCSTARLLWTCFMCVVGTALGGSFQISIAAPSYQLYVYGSAVFSGTNNNLGSVATYSVQASTSQFVALMIAGSGQLGFTGTFGGVATVASDWKCKIMGNGYLTVPLDGV